MKTENHILNSSKNPKSYIVTFLKVFFSFFASNIFMYERGSDRFLKQKVHLRLNLDHKHIQPHLKTSFLM